MMEFNQTCSDCHTAVADCFCFCTNHPVLCPTCRTLHETKGNFHFPLPLSLLEWASNADQQQCTDWLRKIRNCHEKLRADLEAVEQCKQEVLAVYDAAGVKLAQGKSDIVKSLDDLKKSLAAKVMTAIRETTSQPFQPSPSYLNNLIYDHCCKGSLEPITVFRYHVVFAEEYLQDCMEISFSSIPGLSFRDRRAATLRQELEKFRTLLKEADEREQLLNSKYEGLQDEYKLLKLGLNQRPPTSSGIHSPRGTLLLKPLPPKFRPASPPNPIQDDGKLEKAPDQAKFQRPPTALTQNLSEDILRIRLPALPLKSNH